MRAALMEALAPDVSAAQADARRRVASELELRNALVSAGKPERFGSAAARIRRGDHLAGDPELVACALSPVDEGPVSTKDLLRTTAQLTLAWERAGHDPHDPKVRDAILRGIAPAGGGATGRTAVSYARNLPPEGAYVMDPAQFAQWTERNDMPLETRTLTGLGAAPIQQRISNVGVLAALRIVFTGSVVVSGGGTITATYQWPWNVIKRYSLNVNGQTQILNCEGSDLRARRQRIFRNPVEHLMGATPAIDATGNANPGVISNGTYAVKLIYDIPIAHDMLTLVGSLYSQSDQIYLQQNITPGAQAELFTAAGGSTVALTGTFATSLLFYEIPVDAKGMVLLPDMRWLHGYFYSDANLLNTGVTDVALVRAAGQLTSVGVLLDNGGAATIDPLALNAIQFGYGGNQVPRRYAPTEQLLEKNQQDYNGTVKPAGRYFYLDFEADNPTRDSVYPKGVTELKVSVDIPSGTSLNANAHAHVAYETLYAGR
jgi:hypothetical protein